MHPPGQMRCLAVPLPDLLQCASSTYRVAAPMMQGGGRIRAWGPLSWPYIGKTARGGLAFLEPGLSSTKYKDSPARLGKPLALRSQNSFLWSIPTKKGLAVPSSQWRHSCSASTIPSSPQFPTS